MNTTSTWYVTCTCGQRASRDFDTNPMPGLVAGFQCDDCGGIQLVSIPGKRKHLRAATDTLEKAILQVYVEQEPPLTVRGIYYALEVKGIVGKDINGYRKAARQLLLMRRSGAIPYGWIADSTRWQRKPTTYKGLRAALARLQRDYRRDLWATLPVHVEIWIEKDALASVLYPITNEYDVPLMSARGFSSATFAYDAAEAIKAIGKPAYVYHFGDLDPSGVAAAENVQNEMARHGAQCHFERMAVTWEQVEKFKLPTRETKKKDPRARKWGNRPSCELDALPAPILRQLVRDCIERHVDAGELDRIHLAEAAEIRTIAAISKNLVYVPSFDYMAVAVN